ncbi:MAG: Hsp70 family protein, partial [Methanosarcinales archaeon]|nr:Hsp70 family protein [Methanosarcinales archaeon]
TPLSFGIETLGGVNTVLINKNTTIPTAKNQIFSTAVDNQPSVEVNVLQGERPMAVDNKSLGRFILDGIPPTPRGIPQIEVTFDIDSNGILNVSAKDKATGKAQSIRIEGSCGISDEEIEKMKREAEQYAEEDKKKKEIIEIKNIAENMIYTGEKTLKEAGDKIKPELKTDVESNIEELKKIKDGDDSNLIKDKTAKLSDLLQKIGVEMYQQAQQDEQNKEKEGAEENKSAKNTAEDAEIKEQSNKKENGDRKGNEKERDTENNESK